MKKLTKEWVVKAEADLSNRLRGRNALSRRKRQQASSGNRDAFRRLHTVSRRGRRNSRDGNNIFQATGTWTTLLRTPWKSMLTSFRGDSICYDLRVPIDENFDRDDSR